MPARKPAPGELDAIETASSDELQALQLQRLRWTLQHAYDHVAHIPRELRCRGRAPGRSPSARGTSRNSRSRSRPTCAITIHSACSPCRATRWCAFTRPAERRQATVVGYTAKDIDTWATVMARSIRAAGGRAGDIVHVAYGYGLFTGGLGAHYGAEKLGCTVIPMSGGMTERQVQLIIDFKPDIIMVTPSYMLAIAEEMERQRIDPRRTSLQIGIFGAEPWTPAMRRAIEGRLDIDAIDIYGLSEIMGPGVAQECIETKGRPDDLGGSLLSRDRRSAHGAVLPEGEKGELVFTSLTKEALPMIRYRTRDLTRLLPPSSRSMRRMEKITGRSDDMVIIRGVNVFPTQVEDLILKQPELAPHYLLEITRPGSLDENDGPCRDVRRARAKRRRNASRPPRAHWSRASRATSGCRRRSCWRRPAASSARSARRSASSINVPRTDWGASDAGRDGKNAVHRAAGALRGRSDRRLYPQRQQDARHDRASVGRADPRHGLWHADELSWCVRGGGRERSNGWRRCSTSSPPIPGSPMATRFPCPTRSGTLEVGAALGIVMGGTACRVSAIDALKLVAGYTIVNDLAEPHPAPRPSIDTPSLPRRLLRHRPVDRARAGAALAAEPWRAGVSQR